MSGRTQFISNQKKKKEKKRKERIMTDLSTRKDIGYVTEAMGRLEN